MNNSRNLLRAGMLAFTVVFASGAAFAQDSGRLPDGNNPAGYSGIPNSEFQNLQPSLAARRNISLRNEALRLQRKDGGELSPAHARYLQEKLNQLKSE